jgi:hypothetical protein
MLPIFSRCYRLLFCRGGYGVHSPFAFDLITTVIEERRAYYCYEMLDRIRRQLQQEHRQIRYGTNSSTVRKILRKEGFSPRGYRLLFRLTNYFRPRQTLVIGSGLGLTPLYVTAYSGKTTCLVFEPDPSLAVIARNVVRKYAHAPIRIYDKIFCASSDAPELRGKVDFIVWRNLEAVSSDEEEAQQTAHLFAFFEQLLPYITDKSLLVIGDIRASSAKKQLWKKICTHPAVSVTFDFYSFGLVFFHSKLHRKTYKSIFV